MPAKKQQTVAEALNELMGKYQLNPFSLAKKIKLSYTSVRLLSLGEANISVPVALRLGKFFGKPPHYWLDLQLASDLSIALKDKKLGAILNGISKVQMPKATARTANKTGKTAKRNTLAEKRKSAAKVPGARAAKKRTAKK